MVEGNVQPLTHPTCTGSQYRGCAMEWTDPAHFVDLVLQQLPKDSPVITRLVGSMVLPVAVAQMGEVAGAEGFSRHKLQLSRRDYLRHIRSFQLTYERIRSFPDSISYVKYWIDRYMAQAVRDQNSYPESEYSKVPLFSGIVRRFILRRIARQDCALLYSIQKGSKQSWHTLPPSDLLKSLEKHESLICRPVSFSEEHVLQSVAACSRELFSGLREQDFTKFQPTGSACVQKNRKSGGTGALVTAFRSEGEVSSINKNLKIKQKGDDPSLSVPLTISALHSHQRNCLRETLQNLKETILKNPEEAWGVRVTSLAEPGKFRNLSMMNGDFANALQPLQGALLKRWKNFRCSTMLTEDLSGRYSDLMNLHKRLGSPFRKAVSGDYSSATDTLRRDLSFAALSGCDDCEWYPLGYSSLQPGRMVYPAVKDGEKILRPEKVCWQSEGQLMGHPLSFPLLCCINLSTYRCALKRWAAKCSWDDPDRERREWLVCQLYDAVIINGDDISFFADDELYGCWLEEVGFHSFSPSAGKNYLSDRWVQMNSQLFELSWSNCAVKRHGYLAQRIIYGVDVKKTSDVRGGPIEVARDLNRMVELYPPARSVVAMTMRRFQDQKFGYHRPNWYLPVVLGGYGLRPPNPSYRITRAQRLVAAHLAQKPRPLYSEKIEGPRFCRRWSGSRYIVRGAYVPGEFETSEEQNPLRTKAMLVSSWLRMGSPPSAKVVRSFIRPNHRLKAMSREKIETYRSGRLFDRVMPMRLPVMSFPGKCLPVIGC